VAADPGVVDEEIYDAKLLSGATHEVVDDILLGDVADPADGAEPNRSQMTYRLRELLLADVDYDDDRARRTGRTRNRCQQLRR
jgi:hypothetical protein